jgi:hypothetical protein
MNHALNAAFAVLMTTYFEVCAAYHAIPNTELAIAIASQRNFSEEN